MNASLLRPCPSALRSVVFHPLLRYRLDIIDPHQRGVRVLLKFWAHRVQVVRVVLRGWACVDLEDFEPNSIDCFLHESEHHANLLLLLVQTVVPTLARCSALLSSEGVRSRCVQIGEFVLRVHVLELRLDSITEHAARQLSKGHLADLLVEHRGRCDEHAPCW